MKRTLLAIVLAWVLPQALAAERDYTEKECPVAGNVETGVYHVPGGRDYRKMLRGGKERLMRVTCFATEEEAKAARYRKAKR